MSARARKHSSAFLLSLIAVLTICGVASAVRTGKYNGAIQVIEAWDVDGSAYKRFLVATAANTPTCAISAPSGGTLTIDGGAIGGTTPAAGTFTTIAGDSVTATGDVSGTRTVIVSTATFSASAAQVKGSVICNTGDGDAQVISLPPAAAGMWFTVVLTAAQDVDINPDTADQILVLTNAAGDAISSAAAIGNTITLVAVDSTNWIALTSSGTWSDVN